jgi:hypothetical protein
MTHSGRLSLASATRSPGWSPQPQAERPNLLEELLVGQARAALLTATAEQIRLGGHLQASEGQISQGEPVDGFHRNANSTQYPAALSTTFASGSPRSNRRRFAANRSTARDQ